MEIVQTVCHVSNYLIAEELNKNQKTVWNYLGDTRTNAKKHDGPNFHLQIAAESCHVFISADSKWLDIYAI